MELIKHLNIGTPLIWVQTPDTLDIPDIVINNTNREIYSVSVTKGVQVWDRTFGTWMRWLTETDHKEWGPVGDIASVLIRKLKAGGDEAVALVYLPERPAAELAMVLLEVQRSFYDAYRSNDAEKLPVQVVFISSDVAVPPEVANYTRVTTLEPPGPEEIMAMAIDFASKDESIAARLDAEGAYPAIIKATTGLSRSGIINAMSLSVNTHGTLDASWLDEHRRALIKSSTALEILRPTAGLDTIGGLTNLKHLIEGSAAVWRAQLDNPGEMTVKPLQRLLLAGVPGCMTGDTLILTDQGILRYDKLYEGNTTALQVVGQTGKPTEVEALYDRGVHPTVTVKAAGHEVTVTPWHPILTLGRDGSYIWKKAEEITNADRIAIFRGTELWGDKTSIEVDMTGAPNTYRKKVNVPRERPEIPTEMTVELAELLGMIIADGDISDNRFRIHNRRAGIYDRLEHLIESSFKIKPHRSRTLNTLSTEVNSRLVSWWLGKIGMKRGSLNKRVPDCVAQAPRHIVQAFLRGLFNDSNCAPQAYNFKFSSVSKQVSDFVSTALLNMGIVCTRSIDHSDGRAIGREPNPCYVVSVTNSQEAENLLRNITFNREDIREGVEAKTQKPYNPNLDTLYIPDLLRELVGVSNREDRRALYGKAIASNYGKNGRSVGYCKLAIFHELATDSPAKTRVSELLNDNIFWAPVQSVDNAGKQQVYDMTVPEGNAYVANGILNHNTGKSAICKATAATLGMDLVKFGVTQMMNKFIGNSEANMRNAWRFVNAAAPIVCWVDELGRDLSGSHSSNDSGTTDRVHGEFLTGLQELSDGVFLMAAANEIRGLPPEMLRAGRFDHIVFVGFPTSQERAEIWQIYLRGFEGDFNLGQLVEATRLWTGAEIESIVEKAKFMHTINADKPFNNATLLEAINNEQNLIWNRKRGEIIEMYRHADTNFEWASPEQHAYAKKLLSSLNQAPGRAQSYA